MRSMAPFFVVSFVIVGAFGWYARGAAQRDLEAREHAWGRRIRAGDLVFQDLACGPRCEMIREVTHSRYAHVGVVFGEGDERVVWEALAPVGPTPLAEWVARGIDERVAVYRPKPDLARRRSEVERRIVALQGRPYDADYQWDDERIYCSELVAKPYRDLLGVDLVVPHTVDLGARESLIAQMSHGRLTPRTLMVTPADLAESGRFTRIVDELER